MSPQTEVPLNQGRVTDMTYPAAKANTEATSAATDLSVRWVALISRRAKQNFVSASALVRSSCSREFARSVLSFPTRADLLATSQYFASPS